MSDFDYGQLRLLDLPRPVAVNGHHQSIEDRFNEFHAANPHVYQALRRLALDLKRAGRTHYSIKGLFEVLRFTYSMQTQGDDYKLNNNYTSRYARLLMDENPELDGFFETRELRS